MRDRFSKGGLGLSLEASFTFPRPWLARRCGHWFNGLETAADVHDFTTAVNNLKENSNDAAARRRANIHGIAILIPFIAGALVAKIAGEAAEEGAKAVGTKTAKEISTKVHRRSEELPLQTLHRSAARP